MSGRSRTVYFFDIVAEKPDGSVEEFEVGWWVGLMDHLQTSDADDLRSEFRGRKYEGEVRTERAPAARYLYVGKLRPGADWPDIRNEDGEHASLASTGVASAVLEPTYVVPIAGTNYIAVMRSSGGARWSALQTWLNVVSGFDSTDDLLVLRPYARQDQLRRLQQSVGASRIHLKVDPDVLTDAHTSSDVARAMQTVIRAGAGAVSVEMIVSYGNSSPDADGAEALADGVRDIVSSPGFSKAKATLLRQEGDHLVKDQVDFTLDRVTLSEEVGESEDEEPTARSVLIAMNGAIRTFRERLREG